MKPAGVTHTSGHQQA